jgi:DNA polymerase III alpha subunit
MKTDDLGIPRFSNQDLINMIYSGHTDKVHVVLCDESEDVDKFNEAAEENGLPELKKYIAIDADKTEFDSVCQSEWLMPEEYKKIDIQEWFIYAIARELEIEPEEVFYKNPNTPEVKRLEEELEAFYENEMFDLLRYMIYLVNFMRENNIVWGVGRGSSVASYVLYLIGVHKINPIQYGLDWREFLR